MFDWLKAKITNKKYKCFECSNFISNEKMSEINHTYCSGGGFCCPQKDISYYISIDENNSICTKFKHLTKES